MSFRMPEKGSFWQDNTPKGDTMEQRAPVALKTLKDLLFMNHNYPVGSVIENVPFSRANHLVRAKSAVIVESPVKSDEDLDCFQDPSEDTEMGTRETATAPKASETASMPPIKVGGGKPTPPRVD